MPSAKMYSELFSLARTSDEAELLRQELKLLSDALFQRTGTLEEVLAKKVRAKTADVVRKLTLSKSDADKEKFFEGAKKALSELKQLELAIPFEPREESIEKIWGWVVKNVGGGVVLNFRVDRTIGAGTILNFQGVYRNYSLSKLLDGVFESQKEVIAKILAQ